MIDPEVRRKIGEFLRSRPPKVLADEFGVDESTISRWKNGKPIARDHFLKVAEAAKIDAVNLQGVAALPLSRGRRLHKTVEFPEFHPGTPPAKVAALFIRLLDAPQGEMIDRRFKSLSELLSRTRAQSLIEAAGEKLSYRLGFGGNWVQYPNVIDRSGVFHCLDAAVAFATAQDLIMVFVAGTVSGSDDSGTLLLGNGQNSSRTIPVDDLAEQLRACNRQCFLVVQSLAQTRAPGATIDRMYARLRQYGRTGFAIIVAELPSKEPDIRDWPLGDEMFCNAISTGEVDANRDGRITAADFFKAADDRLPPDDSRKPLFLCPEPFDPTLTIGSSLSLASKLTGERSLAYLLREKLHIDTSLPAICSETSPALYPAGTPLVELRRAASTLRVHTAIPKLRNRKSASRELVKQQAMLVYVTASMIRPTIGIPGAVAIPISKIDDSTLTYLDTLSDEIDGEMKTISLESFLDAWEDWGFMSLILNRT